jgi:hypothetical protein
MANEVTVGEIESPHLWQRVLREVHGGLSPDAERPLTHIESEDIRPNASSTKNSGKAADRLAQSLQIERSQLEGALSPTTQTPYLTLDVHCWEKMKKQLVGTGVSSIAALAVAGTLLVIWCRIAGLESPTQSQAQAVLATIEVRDKNASRSIRNASWLQSRPGGQILINPAENSKALLLARCFCTWDWSTWNEQPKRS